MQNLGPDYVGERKWGLVYLSLATGHRHVHEPPGVCDSLLRSALGHLLLLLWVNLQREIKSVFCRAEGYNGSVATTLMNKLSAPLEFET